MLGMSKNMSNRQLAHLLRQMAAAHELNENDFFKVRAYQNAAASIEHASQSIRDIWEEGKLEDIPGVGKAIAEYLDELFRTGRIKHFEAEAKKLPLGMFALLGVPKVGAKSAYKLAKAFGLSDPATARSKLLAATKRGQVAELEGFGEGSQTQLIAALEAEAVKPKAALIRLLQPEAEGLANQVREYLEQSEAVLETEYLGSLRRRAATIGDVDLVVKTDRPDAVMDHLKKFPQLKKIISSGSTTTMFQHESGRQVDVKTGSPADWGSLLQHYTGSKLHNIALRKYALNKGYSLSEYGIKIKGKLKHFESEAKFYSALGMDYIEPEMREDTGEIAAALAGKLPKLVTVSDIKGDFHIHTPIEIATSHDQGSSSVQELLSSAIERGYQYLGFSDHNPKLKDLSLTKKLELIKRRNEVIEQEVSSFEKSVKKKIKVYTGLEVDIRADGELALEDKALELLDYAIVSFHSSFDQDKATATKRVLRALEHPKARIWGHPTGRKLLSRDGLDVDWDRVFEFCERNRKLVEINGTPDRLDLPDMLVREAVGAGVRLIINSDTHEVSQLDNVRYGVYVARRGWASKQDVANTYSPGEFDKVLMGR
jgi:DNA polymerase (family 10)